MCLFRGSMTTVTLVIDRTATWGKLVLASIPLGAFFSYASQVSRYCADQRGKTPDLMWKNISSSIAGNLAGLGTRPSARRFSIVL